MNKTLQRLIAAALIISALVLSGCNTMKGLGEDVENLGEKMQNAGS
ncbi:MAG TPA: entericidin [Opitutae bacterium]|nr:entericidin [Opitutae bacterium]